VIYRALVVLVVLGSNVVFASPDDDELDELCTSHLSSRGHASCTYGSWGANLKEPYLFVDFGMNSRHFSTPAPMIGGLALRTAAASASTSGPSSVTGRPDDTLVFDERIGVGLVRGLYGAIDLELGNFALDSRHMAGRDVVFAGTVSVGYRLGLGPLAAAVEIAGGGSAYAFANSSDLSTMALVEVRGRAELWLSPWMTIGGVAGTSMIRPDEWMVGGYVGFHTHAYAGDR
jgi:hypothetical protein